MSYLELHQAMLIEIGIKIAIIAAGLAIAFTIHAVLWKLFKRAGSLMPPKLHKALLRHTKTSTRIVLLLIGLKIALLYVPVDGSLRHAYLMLHILIIACMGWVVISIVNAISEWLKDRFVWEGNAKDNLRNRRISTQLGIFTKIAILVVMVLTLLAVVMTVPSLRNLGLSLFASAGVAGLIVGMAAKSTLANLLAGVQMAITQPIKLDDVVVVQGLQGNIEEIGSSFVIVKLTDWRRLLVPLNFFMEQPFENWTYDSTDLLGKVLFYLDYNAPVDLLRKEMVRLTDASTLWDKNVRSLQVTDCKDMVIEVRIQVSAATSGQLSDLKCELREKMLAYMHTLNPTPLPRQRSQSIDAPLPA